MSAVSRKAVKPRSNAWTERHLGRKIRVGDTAHAVCMPLHRGRTTIVLETRITRGDGKLAAIVTQTQLVFDAKNKTE